MPNLSDVPDYDLSAIEVTIKETARGRAFLASYARRVRESDTMKLFAMVRRLERWCHDQTARFAELNGDTVVAMNSMPAAERQDGACDPGAAGRMSSQADEASDNLSTADACYRAVEHQPVAEFSSREAMRRLEEVFAIVSELDRRTTSLAARLEGEVNLPAISPARYSALNHDPLEVVPSEERRLSAAMDERMPVQQNLLDDIAKALGSLP